MQSLRIKLIAPFIAGTMVLTLLLAWYTYTSSRQAVEDAMMLISEAKTDQTAGSMTLLFKSMATNIQNLVADAHVTSLFADEHGNNIIKTTDWLDIITSGNEYYRDLLIVDQNGVCVASSNPGHVGISYAGLDYVRQALTGRFTLGESAVGRVTKRFSAIMAGPIDVDGEIVGALIMMNDFPQIVDYRERSTHDDQTVFTAMLSPDGLFTAHKDKDLMGNETRLFPGLYKELSAVGEKGGVVHYSLFGHAYIGYARVEPTTRWVVVTSGRQSEVFAPAYETGLTVLGISFVFLCLISLVVIRFANGILSLLLSLIDYARQVSEGNLELKLEATSRNDELGVLHTALQRLVMALQAMLEETRKASTMKGQFLANMSHEIRTPLNAIIGMAHLTLREGGLSPRVHDFINKIQLSAKSLLGLINDILDISKVEAGMIELEHIPFDLKEVLENVLLIHQESAFGKGLSLELDYAEGTPRFFYGDGLRIGQILNNLLSNAIKFTTSGGVRLRCWREDPPTDGPEELAGTDCIRISVSDTGIGMTPEVLETLFQPFTQADASISRQFGGTGLGLAISDRLVALLHGRFSVTSTPGQGTTFSFFMRIQEAPGGLLAETPDANLDTAFGQLQLQGVTILVAEDNLINQIIMDEFIRPSGATVLLAANGLEAVETVKSRHVDLIFMDLQMPVMDGFEATSRIREFADADSLPIIAVTANALKEDREKGFARGMNGYITKPIEPKLLLEVLRTWTRRKSPSATGFPAARTSDA